MFVFTLQKKSSPKKQHKSYGNIFRMYSFLLLFTSVNYNRYLYLHLIVHLIPLSFTRDFLIPVRHLSHILNIF